MCVLEAALQNSAAWILSVPVTRCHTRSHSQLGALKKQFTVLGSKGSETIFIPGQLFSATDCPPPIFEMGHYENISGPGEVVGLCFDHNRSRIWSLVGGRGILGRQQVQLLGKEVCAAVESSFP